MIITFRNSNKLPVLQQMLQMFSSWPNALSTTAEDVVYSPVFFSGNYWNIATDGGRCFLFRPECVDLFYTIYLPTNVIKCPKSRLILQPYKLSRLFSNGSIRSSVSDKRLGCESSGFFFPQYFSDVTTCLDSVIVLNIVCFSAAVFQNWVCWKCHGKFGAILPDNHLQVNKLGQ